MTGGLFLFLVAFFNEQILSNHIVFIFSRCYALYRFHSIVFNEALCVLDTPAEIFRNRRLVIIKQIFLHLSQLYL